MRDRGAHCVTLRLVHCKTLLSNEQLLLMNKKAILLTLYRAILSRLVTWIHLGEVIYWRRWILREFSIRRFSNLEGIQVFIFPDILLESNGHCNSYQLIIAESDDLCWYLDFRFWILNFRHAHRGWGRLLIWIDIRLVSLVYLLWMACWRRSSRLAWEQWDPFKLN